MPILVFAGVILLAMNADTEMNREPDWRVWLSHPMQSWPLAALDAFYADFRRGEDVIRELSASQLDELIAALRQSVAERTGQ